MSKITYLITRSDTVGGAHVHLLDLAYKAQTEGHKVEVLVGGNGSYAALLLLQRPYLLEFPYSALFALGYVVWFSPMGRSYSIAKPVARLSSDAATKIVVR